MAVIQQNGKSLGQNLTPYPPEYKATCYPQNFSAHSVPFHLSTIALFIKCNVHTFV